MVKQFLKQVKTKEGKALLENFFSLSLLQIVGMLLPLFTLPYIINVVGFDKYGTLVFANSLVIYFTSLTDYSFKITATRDVAVFKNSKNKLDLTYSKVIIVKSIFLVISLLLISVVVLLYPPLHEDKHIYFLTSLSLVGYVLFPDWFFQGIEKMKNITFLNLGIKIFFTLCVFIFIRRKEDFWLYPLFQAIGIIGAGIVGQYILIYKYKLKFIWLPTHIIKQTIKKNFPIFINQSIPTLYNNTSIFLLGLFDTKVMVGIYQAILTIVNLGTTFLEILSRVFFPFLNRRKNAFTKYRKMMLGIVLIICVGILLSYKVIFWYLSITYENAFLVLVILTVGIIGYVLYDIFGLNYFIVHREDKLVMRNTVTASIIGFFLAFPLIHFFGIVGSALNLTISRWLMGGGLLIKYLKKNSKYFWPFQKKIIGIDKFTSNLLGIKSDFVISKIVKFEKEKRIEIYLRYRHVRYKIGNKEYYIYDETPLQKWQYFNWFDYECVIKYSLPRYVKDGRLITAEATFVSKGISRKIS
ncbi:oligosaccharide flippase family protein [Capnocytophaga cynodegmi]|uniref:oligosaccharide flippase family protein n=1 Tax=Capnocytophaga cynodegmi TaxID=28189 RepID=UPI00385D67E7